MSVLGKQNKKIKKYIIFIQNVEIEPKNYDMTESKGR